MSVKNLSEWNWAFISASMSAISTVRTGTQSSLLMIVTSGCGVSLALPNTNPSSLLPPASVTFMSATAAMACVEALQKMQSSLFVELLREMEVYLPGILTCSRSLRESLHSGHSLSFFSGSGSSYSQASVVSSLSKALPQMLTGTAKPSVSQRLFIVNNVSLQVLDFSVADTWKVNSSVATSQLIPRVQCMGRKSALRERSFKPSLGPPWEMFS